MSDLHTKSIFITGANRGIGAALVEEALARGAAVVYAASRQPVEHPDSRVVGVPLELTNQSQVSVAAGRVGRLDVLINNAGIALYDDLSDPAIVTQHVNVNVLGPLALTTALLPQLSQAQGHVVNNLSINALAPMPMIASYSASKAAGLSITQSLRSLLATRGITVHAVLTGPVDTDMSAGIDIPKATPRAVASAIYDGIANGELDIFPDATSAQLAEAWRSSGAKALEIQYAEMAAALAAGTAV